MEKLITWLIVGAIMGIAVPSHIQHEKFKTCKKNGGKIFRKSKGVFFYEEMCVLEDEIVRGGFKVGKSGALPPDIMLMLKDRRIEKKIISRKKIYFAFSLSVIGLIVWIIPIFGLLVSIFSLITAVKGINVLKKMSIITIILCIIGIILSLVNASIGAYQGLHGSNERVNAILR